VAASPHIAKESSYQQGKRRWRLSSLGNKNTIHAPQTSKANPCCPSNHLIPRSKSMEDEWLTNLDKQTTLSHLLLTKHMPTRTHSS
jgi:hypothetical protein